MKKKCNFNKLITLFENDFYRSLKIVMPLIGIFFIAHIAVASIWVFDLKKITNEGINNPGLANMPSMSRRAAQYGCFSLFNQSGIDVVTAISIAVIALYTLLLWNREWRGGTKSIYTLLSLPIKKGYIVFSKLFTMIIFIGFNVLVQILTLFIDKSIMKYYINEKFYVEQDVLGVFATGYRATWINLISKEIWASLVTIIAIILILGIIILLFRSFKIKGILLGVLLLVAYIGINAGVFIYFKLYWDEFYIFRIIFSLIASILAFEYSKYLLENKVAT